MTKVLVFESDPSFAGELRTELGRLGATVQVVDDGNVGLQVSNGRYVAHMPPSDQERLLFISAMYRPEWRATAADKTLTVHPIANAFLGVTVPAGITDVTVQFTPRVQIALTWFSNLVLLGSVAATFVVRRRRDNRMAPPANAEVA